MTIEELQNAKRRKLIDPIIYFDEDWKRIDFIPDLPPIYWISNYGRVYNESTGYIMDGHILPNGYELMSFYKTNGDRIWCHVHRLLMLAFHPIPNPELYVVNHKNGKKHQNYDDNLEWTDQKGNVEHAFATGLRQCGEGSSHAIFTNDQVHKVCKCMEDGMNLHELSQTVFGIAPTQQIKSLCTNIYSKKFWKEISSNYNIDNYKRDRVFSKPQVHTICKELSKDSNIKTDDLLKILNITNYSKSDYEIYNRAIWNIRRGKSFKEISSQYNI